jgi:single-strand DNA-binding protein
VVNKVQLLGYLRQEPTVSHTPNGTPYTMLVIETERSWRDTEGQKHTNWEVHTVQVWRALAKACGQCLRINQLVYIEGRLHTREGEGDQNAKQHGTAVIAEQVKFLPHYHPPGQKAAGRDVT